MDKSIEDKCEWTTCGTTYLMRNISREFSNGVKTWKACPYKRCRLMSLTREGGFPEHHKWDMQRGM